MSVARGSRQQQCEGKKWYTNKDEARRHIARVMAHGGREMQVYRCRFCHRFHVGNKRVKR